MKSETLPNVSYIEPTCLYHCCNITVQLAVDHSGIGTPKLEFFQASFSDLGLFLNAPKTISEICFWKAKTSCHGYVKMNL